MEDSAELDERMLRFIEDEQHATSACLGYHGYPKATCISINEVVCHGIPRNQKLHMGDIVNIDVTVIKDGFHGDTSKMFVVGGHTTAHCQKLCDCARECLYAAIRRCRPGADLTEIGDVIEPLAKRSGFSVVRDYCGHGLGRNFHELPQVLHYKNDEHLVLREGMTFTIEPMINAGTWKCKAKKKDGWTVFTADRRPSAQYEHTLAITATGCEVLTLRQEEDFPRVLNADNP